MQRSRRAPISQNCASLADQDALSTNDWDTVAFAVDTEKLRIESTTLRSTANTWPNATPADADAVAAAKSQMHVNTPGSSGIVTGVPPYTEFTTATIAPAWKRIDNGVPTEFSCAAPHTHTHTHTQHRTR